MSAAPYIRPLERSDLPNVADVSAAAFGVDISEPTARARWLERVRHPWVTDPEGAFVAERDGQLVGVAEAIMREHLWVLSLLAIDPRGQSGGAGRLLMRQALGYGPADAPGLIVSSNDPRALRLYALSGFTLRPTFDAQGVLDHRALPRRISGVVEDTDPNLELLASVSRAVRGAPQTPELEWALRRGARLLRAGDRGFAVAQPGQVWMLAARDEDTATALLWSALALSGTDDPVRVRWVGGEQQWAIHVLLRARLNLTAYGALAIRGKVGPLAPYIPSGPFA